MCNPPQPGKGGCSRPGATLGQMSRARLDGESRGLEYLASMGFRVERFSKSEMQKSRTPDFRFFAEEGLAFYCEVKTAQEETWLDKQQGVVRKSVTLI